MNNEQLKELNELVMILAQNEGRIQEHKIKVHDPVFDKDVELTFRISTPLKSN